MPSKPRYSEFVVPRPNPPFMSGVPELLVLRLLAKREMYGYELVRAIRLTSNEVIVLAEGVVYPVLHALEEQGLLRSKEKAVNGRKENLLQRHSQGMSAARYSFERMEEA